MAVWTNWELVDNVYEATTDGLIAWTNPENLESGLEASVNIGLGGGESNRIAMWNMAATFPTMTTSHRLRRIALKCDMQDDPAAPANRLIVYWIKTASYWQLLYPNSWPTWVTREADVSIAGWGFPTTNDGQAAMESLLNQTRYLKIQAENYSTNKARLRIKNLYMRLNYDPPPPPPPQNASLFLGM